MTSYPQPAPDQPVPDPNEIQRAARLLFRPGDVIELRAPKSFRDGTISGYFDNFEELTVAATRLDGRAPGIYVTLNPVATALLARCANKTKFRAELTTSDTNIVCRRWLLVDLDPARAAGISSTDEEHERAIERARTTRTALMAEGWPEPLLIDSGNGAHLYFRLPDLPNDRESTELVKRCLAAFNKRFGDAFVSVDQAVFNAARITKLPGTVARKGDHMPDRPHRLSRILEEPHVVTPVPIELLTQAAAQLVESPQSTNSATDVFSSRFDLESWIAHHQLPIRRGPLPWDGHGEKWELEECPFNPEHVGGCAVITRGSNGALGFKCHHNSCAGKGWRELRVLLDGEQANRRAVSSSVIIPDPIEDEPEPDTLPAFPECAWRGIFADYREVMDGTTESSDVAHFATLWAAIAVILGRKVSMFAGDEIFANIYLLFFGPTGDKKTTAQRRIFKLLPDDVQVLRNVGSPEGMSDRLQQEGASDTVYLCFWEEIGSMLARARWSSSSILEFLTETFDCPPEFRLNYRKQPVYLPEPTPTVLAGTTPEWFWKSARPEDFYGGYGNRVVYLTGKKKEPLPSPLIPNPVKLELIVERLRSLQSLPRTGAVFTDSARKLFDKFYTDWETEERSALFAVAIKRIHVYVRKLAMVFAACEGTLPEVTLEQTKAAISVGLYASECASLLVDAQSAYSRPEAVFENKVLTWLKPNNGASKRRMQQTLSKYAGSCEVFNRTLKNLQQADRIDIREGKVYLR